MPQDPDERVPVPRRGEERETLDRFLDYYRGTIVWKVSGMSDEDIRQVIVPSGWSPLSMVKHLAYVERSWFQMLMAGEKDLPILWTDEDPDADFRVEEGETAEEILHLYRNECEASRSAAARFSLDDLTAHWPEDRPPERQPNLRWIYLHMIEETARHAGHLDVARELIDGVTGD